MQVNPLYGVVAVHAPRARFRSLCSCDPLLRAIGPPDEARGLLGAERLASWNPLLFVTVIG